jgi:NAD+ dependent glucose-6-phosphate dehydrogenase
MKTRVFITGSEGQIGKVLSGELAKKFEIYRVDIVNEKKDNYYQLDISNYLNLTKLFKKIPKIKYVIHLAADSGVDAPWDSVLKNNLIGTRNVYECARKFRVKRVIFASSNHAGGGYEGIPPKLHRKKKPEMISVSDPIRPDGYYGTSKVFGEAIARQFYELYGLESVCFRIGSFISSNDPRQDKSGRLMKTWLSHRDFVQLVNLALKTPVKFGIYYAISNNKGRYWDIETTKKELGYKPQDDASNLKKTR